MPQSTPYQLSTAIVAALRLQFDPDGVAVRDNPSTPSQLADGERVVFVEDVDDDRIAQPNMAERRVFKVNIGVINRSADARAACDADMQSVKAVMVRDIPAACRQLKQAGAADGFSAPREGKRVYRIEGIDVGGALIVTQFEIEYITANTQARGRA